MGGTMIKNLIIIGFYNCCNSSDIGITDVFNYVEIGFDKLQELYIL